MIDVTYSRKDKAYQWTCPDSGEIFQFVGKGAKVKAEAWRFAVSMLDPDLFDLAQRMIEAQPHTERVIWRAVELIINDAVEVFDVAQGDVVAKVQSSDEYGRYSIKQTAHGYTCQCHHFTNLDAPLLPSGQYFCKHIAAVQIWRIARAPY